MQEKEVKQESVKRSIPKPVKVDTGLKAGDPGDVSAAVPATRPSTTSA